jgi:hypothetical protein
MLADWFVGSTMFYCDTQTQQSSAFVHETQTLRKEARIMVAIVLYQAAGAFVQTSLWMMDDRTQMA